MDLDIVMDYYEVQDSIKRLYYPIEKIALKNCNERSLKEYPLCL